MRVCLDISPALFRPAGIGRYVTGLTEALVHNDSENEYVAFSNRASEARLKNPFAGIGHLSTPLSDKPWRISVLAAHLARLDQDRLFPGIEVFHGADNLLPRLSRIRTVFTLHDLAFRFYPETFTPLNRWYLTMMIPRFLRAADAIIVDSECTMRDAIRFYGIPEERLRVVLPGVKSLFRPVSDPRRLDEVRSRYALPERFILYVGTIEPRKNLATLFEALKILPLTEVKLVIVGLRGWLSHETFVRLKRLGLDDRAILTGFVPDDDLPALYSLAEVFAYPSFYEGFGLPVLEAMACGTPVVSSNSSSLPEVVGDGGILVAPADAAGWKEALERLLTSAELKTELRERGLRRAAHFTWEAAALSTREVYRQVHANRPRSPYGN
jgi:glycosyltransferase involved in cell wall biosynthesis